MTPTEFRAVARARGYTLADLARLWQLSRARVTQIASDSGRAPVYELALWAVPPKRTAAAVQSRRRQFAAALAERMSPRGTSTTWEIELQAVFMVGSEQGSHLPEGSRGYVDARERRRDGEHVHLRFDTGYHEWFSTAFLKDPDCFLVETGASADWVHTEES